MANASNRAPRIAAPALCALLVTLFASARASAHPLDAARELPELSAYFGIGVSHILGGIDHLLFLGGLLLAGGRMRDLLLSATAFTLAHSLALAAHVLGIVRVDPAWIEPLIALSIAYVGAMNLLGRGASARYSIAFGFGLVHGLGFAGALAETGVPQDRVAAALLLFNAGVEAGQLAVLAVLVPVGLYGARRFARLAPAVGSGMNACLVLAGLIWAASRVLSLPAPEVAAAAPAHAALPASTDTAASAVRGGAVPRSIYPSDMKVDPRAQKLCAAFQTLPRTRRAECAGRKPSLDLAAECTRTLSAALASGALRIDDDSAERCVADMHARYGDCAFTAATALSPLPACTSLWRGTLAAGTRCRSSLECQEGSYCRGLSPLDTGICAPPEAHGARCGGGIDPLSAYVPHERARHEECAGGAECGQGRCRPIRGT